MINPVFERSLSSSYHMPGFGDIAVSSIGVVHTFKKLQIYRRLYVLAPWRAPCLLLSLE